MERKTQLITVKDLPVYNNVPCLKPYINATDIFTSKGS